MTAEPGAVRPGDERAPSAGTAPFIEAIHLQLARTLEGRGEAGEVGADELTRRLAAVLDAVARGLDEVAATLLAEEPLLLSAVFQNADLLYDRGYPFAERLGVVTLTAIHMATTAAEESGGPEG